MKQVNQAHSPRRDAGALAAVPSVAGAGGRGPEGDLVPSMRELAVRREEREDSVEREAIAVTVPVHRVRTKRAGRGAPETFDARFPSHPREKREEGVAENGRSGRGESVHSKRLTRQRRFVVWLRPILRSRSSQASPCRTLPCARYAQCPAKAPRAGRAFSAFFTSPSPGAGDACGPSAANAASKSRLPSSAFLFCRDAR